MHKFLVDNWLSILSIVIGIVVAYIFYRLQKKDTASAYAERKKHATSELLDVVESYIINKQRLSEHVIDNLIHASERDHFVELQPRCTAISLLQDVALRLQRSRHLDIPQKSEYSEKIEELISQIRQAYEDEEPIHFNRINSEVGEKIAIIETMLIPERAVEAKSILSSLGNLANIKSDISLKNEKNRELATLMALALGISTSLATAFIGSRVLESVTNSPITSILSKVIPLIGAFLACIVVLQFIATALRIKRRKTEGESDKA
jgi:uncharacterized membrane-anchored protein YhcB (DUF1043 family)